MAQREDVAAEPSSGTFTIPRSAISQVLLGVGVVIVIAVLVAIGIGLSRLIAPQDPLASAINHHEYQAVFLTNGQVYFGALSAPGGSFYYLTDVYYLASQKGVKGGKSGQSLVPIGRAIHGPEDQLIINRSEIAWVENLKPSGAVSRAITRATGHHP